MAVIIAAVAQRMWDDQHLASFVSSMHAGPDGPEPIPFPKCEGEPASPLNHPLKPKVDIDILRLEGTTTYDTFTLNKIAPPKPKGDLEIDLTTMNGKALYGLASFCNHSCLPSARRVYFGDFLTIRATRPMKKGEEITIEYTDVSESGYQSASDRLSLRWSLHATAPNVPPIVQKEHLRTRIVNGWSRNNPRASK